MTGAADPVHVVNGDSVAGTLALSGLGGSVVVWRDVLCEGPVPPGDPDAVRRARAAFLAGAGMGREDEILSDLEAADAALVAALDGAHETVLWFEHDLHDQLQLIQILARIADHPRRDAVRLISIDRHPAHPSFAGLGELSTAELAALWPERRPLEDGALEAAGLAYDAFRRGDAHALAAIADGSLPGLPFLARALCRLLEERPWTTSGLARSERQILRAVADGARTPHAVFSATWQMEEAPYLGDRWVFRRIDELTAGERPLLARGEEGLALTAAGRNQL
jgi:hypothetical protein